jgi:hypothetical protein
MIFSLTFFNINVIDTKCYLKPQLPVDEFISSNYYFGSVYNQPKINTTFYIIKTTNENKLWIPCTYYDLRISGIDLIFGIFLI